MSDMPTVVINAEPLKRAFAAAEADLQRSYGGDYSAMARAWPGFVVLLLRAELKAHERHNGRDADRFVKYLNDTLKEHKVPFRMVREPEPLGRPLAPQGPVASQAAP
jgi:hypothetical protein